MKIVNNKGDTLYIAFDLCDRWLKEINKITKIVVRNDGNEYLFTKEEKTEILDNETKYN